MAPLIITAALYGPEWLPGDADIRVRMDGQKGFLAWETERKKMIAKTGGDSHPMACCMVPPAKAGKGC